MLNKETLYKKIKKNKKGFTLIELIIVIAIVGVLVAAAMMNYGGSSEKAKQSTVFSDMETIATAVNVYYAENGNKLSGYLNDNCSTLINGGYLQVCPKAPHKDGAYIITFNNDNYGNPKVDIIYNSNSGKVSMDYLNHSITTTK